MLDGVASSIDSARIAQLQQRVDLEFRRHGFSIARAQRELETAASDIGSTSVEAVPVLHMSDADFRELRDRLEGDRGTRDEWNALADARDSARSLLDRLPAQRELLDQLAGKHDLAATVGAAHLATVRAFFVEHGVTDEHGTGPVDVNWDAGRARPKGPSTSYSPRNDQLRFAFDRWSDVSHATSLDLVAHEYAHRVVSKLVPGWSEQARPGTQAGAISESLADTFAMAIDTGDWTIGEDITPGGVRTLERGRTVDDWHVDHDVDDYGQHDMAAIPSAAAKRIGQALGRETMGELYLHAVRTHLKPGDDFEALAAALGRSAADLYGPDSREALTVERAWEAVLDRAPRTIRPNMERGRGLAR